MPYCSATFSSLTSARARAGANSTAEAIVNAPRDFKFIALLRKKG